MTQLHETNVLPVNGIRMQYLSQGAGPLVIFLHGFPELGRSWRHQIGPVATAGYRAVAPDLRGYGGTDAPADPELYTQFHLAGDIVALIEALGYEQAILVAHDLGAALAWSMAMTVPHRVRGLVALSVPHKPRGEKPPLAGTHADFYQRRFQELGTPETDLESNVATFLPGLFDRCSGTSSAGDPPALMVPPDHHFSSLFPAPPHPPAWLGETELRAYVEAFSRGGFRGPLNWYRNIDVNWHLSAPWWPGHVHVPAAYIVGDRDPVYAPFQANGIIASMAHTVPNLVSTRVLAGCGHWTAQERPGEVTQAILEFLGYLDRTRT